MTEKHPELLELQKELEQYKNEKENIRKLVGQIGGTGIEKRDRIINVVFISLLAMLFGMDLLRHILHIEVPVPAAFSLELGVLMISIKIIWMMHKQAKVDHFQFWILNSIEFRLNAISKKLTKMDKKIPAPDKAGRSKK
jgi:hypothetical protein